MSVAVIQSGRFVFSPLSLSPALWVDPSDASSVTISGSSGAHIGPNGLVLPGSGNNYGFMPDQSLHRPTGDFTMYADVTATDWTPAALMPIFMVGGSASAAAGGYYLYLFTDGTLRLFRPAGGTTSTYTSSVATGVTDGTRKKIKITWDQNNGSAQSEAKFYLSDDGVSWTQLGTAVTNANTSAGNSPTAGTFVGVDAAGASTFFNGTVHRVQSWSDLTETAKIIDADFESATPYVSAFTESALGAPVYVVSTTASTSTANYHYVGPTGLVCSGSGANYASAPDLAAYDLTAEMEIVVRANLNDWTPATASTLVSHNNASTGTAFTVHTDGTLKLVTNAATSTSTVALGGTDGTAYWLKATYKDSTDEVKFWWAADASTEPGSWTQLGTTVAQVSALSASTSALFVGSLASASQVCAGTIYRAVIRSTIGGTAVFDANFVTAADYCATFTESSTNAATVTITATNTPSRAAGALVSQINDLSGNARHLTQATTTKMPKYWNGHNGLNLLVFDGTDDVLSTAGTVDLTAGYTYVAVWRVATIKSFNGLFRISSLETNATSPRAELYGNNDGKIQQASNRYGTISGALTTTSAGTIQRTYRISVPTDVESAVTSSFNNSSLAFSLLGAANNLPDDAQRAWLGLGYSTNGYFNGTFGEVTVISPEITGANETLWETYANTKWAVY
jgi:hypothetical protein